MPTEEQAVELMEELGLTEYEARCFVALSRVPEASASDISTLSDVPRSRVYDSVDRLHRRGLVDVQQTEPRQYRALPKEIVLERLRDQYTSTLDDVDDALSGLQRTKGLEEKGAWAIADHDNVTDRIGLFLESAEREVYVLVADEDMLDEQFCDQLSAVADDAAVLVEVASDAVSDRVREAVPSASVATTELAEDPAELEGKWLGRIVMADRRAVLTSAVTETARPGKKEETALWAAGPDHGLVVGIRHVLGDRIDNQGLFD